MASISVEARLLELISNIYDCATDPAKWPSALQKLTNAFNAENGVLLSLDTRSAGPQIHFHAHWNADAAQMARYNAEFAHDNPLNAFAAFPVDQPYNVLSIMSEPEFRQTRIYREFAKPLGWLDSFGVTFMRNPYRIANITFVRNEKAGFANPDDMSLLAQLSPHLRRALSISDLLEMREVTTSNMEATLDLLASGVFLLDADGNLLHANKSAMLNPDLQQVARLFDGGIHKGQNRNCRLLSAALASETNQVTAISGNSIAIPLEFKGGIILFAHVLPLRGGASSNFSFNRASFAVFVSPASQNSIVAQDVWAAAFRITSGESRVLELLLAGNQVADIANQLGLSVATVRTHLKRLFEKTDSANQAELMAKTSRLLPSTGLQV